MSQSICAFFLLLALLLDASLAEGELANFRATLSQEEIAWLNAHPVIRFSNNPDYAPVEYIDDKGQYAGMGADYLALLAKRLGVRFERVPVVDFYEGLKLVREKKSDLIPMLVETPQRAKYLNFTAPYLYLPSVVITARNDIKNWSLDSLRTMKVAVVHGFYTEEWLSHEYPDIDLVQTPDIETALMTTSFGVADVTVGDLAAATYYISKNNITNLRVAFQLNKGPMDSIGIRNDMPILRNVLDKALASITEQEKKTIANNWIKLKPPAWWWNPNFQLFALIVLIGLGIIILTLAWNRTLAKKVKLRTQALEDAHARLIQADKLESVGRLATGVAHEVKNPLAIILMGVEFLAAEIPQESDAGSVLRDIEEAVHRADGIVKGLLDFSREKKLTLCKTDLNEVVRDSLKLVNYELNRHNIAVEEALARQLLVIEADPDKLKQVFINLLMNAIQAMGQGGELKVSSELVRLKKGMGKNENANGKFRPGERVIIINIEDNGPGINQTALSKVFDPFFTTKPVGQGTGLGLSVSRSIVELHGGVISLSNRNGGGALVTLMFKTA